MSSKHIAKSIGVKVQPSNAFGGGRELPSRYIAKVIRAKNRFTASALGYFVDEGVYSGVTMRLMASLKRPWEGNEAQARRSLVEPKVEMVAPRELRGWYVR